MRIARIASPTGAKYVVADGDNWAIIEDPFAVDLKKTGETVPIDGAQLLSPIEPRLIVGIGHNLGNNEHPLPIQAWLKSVHTVAGPEDAITMRRDVGTVNIEGELAVVIGSIAEDLTLDNAFDAVLGYTIVNDVTNVDQSKLDEKNFQGKGGTNYSPFGPWIETELADPENVAITVSINGDVAIESGSFNLPSSVAATLVYTTKWLTLYPGDVVMTGSPKTMTAVSPGDHVDITLDGIGTLSNSVN